MDFILLNLWTLALSAQQLTLRHSEVMRESRDLEQYLDLVGLEAEARERVRNLAPGPTYPIDVGWYVSRKPSR